MDTVELAKKVRKHCLRMCHKAKSSHIGSCLSVVDILAVLYGSVMRYAPLTPAWEHRDRLILSKGHAAAALYAVLAETGFFPVEDLDTYCQVGSLLTGHVNHLVPGVELSTGSLGHGLSVGCGMALALRNRFSNARVFVILSDGELDEGSTWEAVMFAGHHELNNLTAIVDWNRHQGMGSCYDILKLRPLGAKFAAFRWREHGSDYEDHGHHHNLLRYWLQEPAGRPRVMLARTTKGKGVSFMENNNDWHYRSPNDDELAKALEELK